jgi:hypothetical protein
MTSADRLARRVSTWLAIVAALTSAASFFFWGAFHRDVPMGVGNLRGTALTVLVLAVPAVVVSAVLAGRGSLRARIVWAGALAYIAYNAVMFAFQAHFNIFFLLFTTMLGLSFWSLVTLLRAIEPDRIARASGGVPVRPLAAYALACVGAFGLLWLRAIVPAVLTDTTPEVLEAYALPQNAVWVLDFAFTFPLMTLGALWLWRRRPWGYVVAGMMIVMTTIETAGIAVDQVFGHVHDPSAALGAVPVMIAFTVLGLAATIAFLREIREPARRESARAAGPRLPTAAVGPSIRA